MEGFIQKLATISQKLKSGENLCPRQQYGIVCYLCGLLSHKNENLDELYTFFDNLQYLWAQKQISSAEYQYLMSSIYQKPDQAYQISLVLERLIRNSDLNLSEQLQNIKKPLKDDFLNDLSQNIQKNDTVEIEQQQNINGANKGQINKQEFHQKQYYEQLKRNMAQSEALAKQLQAEQQQNAKKYMADDDAVCQVCYVGLYEEQFYPLENCSHIFHNACLSEAFKAQISQKNFPLKCPSDVCQFSEVKDSDIKHILERELYEKYQSNTLKFYADLNGDSISWCPTADCHYMFFYQKQDDVKFHCPECNKQYCLNCRVDWHKEMTCKEFQVSNTHSSEDEKFLTFVKGKKFKQCPKCKFWVQKNKGCDHMTCKCKFQFCYKCGGVFMKCECVQKAKEQQQRRRKMQEQKTRKKQQRLQKNKKQDGRSTRNTRRKRGIQ